jgi:small subunit ribosomal protein S20
MANHKSAIKRHRQSLKRRDRNRDVRANVRTAIKKVRALIEKGDETGAKASLLEAEKTIAKASAKGLYHKKNASRKISRLTKLVSKSKKA